ncbi:thioredoxin [Methanococcoides alaskense]|uniref:Thioredoxin 1 n=1 Tax=Methanococcoides alaskense TaxID=325778 RepID=A0AA90TZD8_9EURY|nr:thioredoxin [Methanococcoides alaskense]MDA0524794.1 thioredoxin [Methanococcoides alaskense]MDR6223083.1 thioredoxin 1 [Methanococcoides alaskense]
MDDLEKIRKQRLEQIKKGLEAKAFPDAPIHVMDADFNEFISKYPITVIDCWAEWCGPCRKLIPIIDALAREYQGKIVFGKLNTDENQMIARNFNITSIPTLLVFKNGKAATQIVGALQKEQLVERLNRFIQ